MEIRANVVLKITGMMQRMPINSERLGPLIKDYQLADSLPNELEVSTVEFLIGTDYYWFHRKSRKWSSSGLDSLR